MKVSRELLKKKLQAVLDRKLSVQELHKWVEKLYPSNFEPLDFEGDDSITIEIMGQLDMIDIDGLTNDRIKNFIMALDTPIGKFKEGLKRI